MSTDIVLHSEGGVPVEKEHYDPRDLLGYPGEYTPGEAYPDSDKFEALLNLGALQSKMFLHPTSLAVVSDRGPLNLRALTGFAEMNRGSFRVSGVIAPGSEIDDDVLEMARWMYPYPNLDFDPLLRPGREPNIDIHRGDFEISYEGNPLFRFVHEGYNMKKLKQAGEAGEIEREEFCDRLILQLLQMEPNIIFLDNFKVFLAPNIVRQFPNRIINVHPSVLPLIKGFRPEKRAFEGENPEANGYTMHVVNEEMDRGPTLFQQQVTVLPLDEDKRKTLGDSEYKKFREEQARLRIMYAQRYFAPWVLAVYNTDLERKTVEGEEAFVYEGRPGFSESDEYQRVLQEDPRPYQRMVFRNPAYGVLEGVSEWVTMERLLSAPAISDVPSSVGGLFDYRFSLPSSNGKFDSQTLGRIITDLQTAGLEPTFEQFMESVSLRTLGSCATILAEHNISALQARQPTHVLSQRKPIKRQEIVRAS